MKLRITLVGYADGVRKEHSDVTLTVDVTATVGEVARGLVRAGAGNPQLLPFATHRQAPMTLRVTYPDRAPLILDAGSSVAEAGLQSGTLVEPVLESHPGEGRRAKEPAATITVLEGPQQGVSFIAAQGETSIGRDRANRIELHDRSVSRRHAVLRTGPNGLTLEDLGSANGTAELSPDGARELRRSRTLQLGRSSTVEIGNVPVRIDAGAPAGTEIQLDSSIPHLQSPRVDPVFTPDPIELPAPPDPAEPNRFPLIAMVAPLLMGAVLYLTTKSVLSLIFIGLSPLIMIGTWLDNRISRRKTTRVKREEFTAGLALARRELEGNLATEQSARSLESPPPKELLKFPTDKALQLWTRRPEHRAFLELRLGEATMPSRKDIVMPPRGKIPAEDWEEITQLRDQYQSVPGVPVLERLDRSGSLAIAGPEHWATAVTRSLLVQLLALHSPADLVFTAFTSEQQAQSDWGWMKWVPHVDSPYTPLSAPHLVADHRSSTLLLTALEGLIQQRGGTSGSQTVRSRMEGDAATASERLSPAASPGPHPAVIVLVLCDTLVDRTRLVGLAEDGADVGVHVIWLAPHMGAVPAACRTVVEVTEHAWRAHFVRQGEVVDLTQLDFIDASLADTFARALAPIVDAGARVLDESDLPRSVALGQIVASDILGSSEAVLRNWTLTDSLTARWVPGTEREPGQLSAVVGQGSAGPVEIDLRTHGPHALVGGTTGSGKSEFLQTWILSLAANYSPDRLTFLLVDYKGGAAFADCVNLPHTVGLVTDLNTHLVRRALTSLRAELRYREELLAEKSAKDLIALERRGDPDTPPTLVIVIDEFAALVSEIPDFVDGVIDVAQRGRSLGLHLVMATQRPAGVIKDNLRANTNLRVGLRMADPADSTDVLGTTDAAHFAPETPGRSAVKVGAGQLTHFQAAYLGGRSETDHQETVEVSELGFGDHTPWALHPEEKTPAAATRKGPRDIEVLARNVREAALAAATQTPRKPWVDQLPDVLPLAEIGRVVTGAAAAESDGVTVGLIDEPHMQQQSAYAVQFDKVGNLAIFGGAGSGKSTALITLAYAAITDDPNTIVYGIDAGGGGLAGLAQLPNTGDIVLADERDRVIRLLNLVKQITIDRTADNVAAPRVLLLLDGFAAFRDSFEHAGRGTDPFADLVEIARAGRTVGVHVCFTSERATAFPTALASSIPERLALRLPAESDYQMLGVPAEALTDAPAGRSLRIGTDNEIQWAVPGESEQPADTEAALAALAAEQTALGIVRPEGVPAIPDFIRRREITRTEGGGVPFAIDTTHLAPVAAPSTGLLLVTGPAGSGRTATIKSLLEAFAEQSELSGEPLDALLLSPRRSQLRDLPLWGEVADSVSAREAAIDRLTLALGGTAKSSPGLPLLPLIGAPIPTAADIEEELPVAPFPMPGARGIVVVEDIGGFDGSGNEQALAALLKLLRRSDLTVIVEGENATLGTVWELSSPLRGARWAIALRPDANDTPSLFTTPFSHTKRADYPEGRGFLIENGALRGIHVGLAE